MPPHFVYGGLDPRLPLAQIHRSPVLVLLSGQGNRGYGLVMVDARRARDPRAVDRCHMIAWPADPLPFTAEKVKDPVALERLGCDRARPGVDLVPRGAGLQGQGHTAIHSSGARGVKGYVPICRLP